MAGCTGEIRLLNIYPESKLHGEDYSSEKVQQELFKTSLISRKRFTECLATGRDKRKIRIWKYLKCRSDVVCSVRNQLKVGGTGSVHETLGKARRNGNIKR